MEQGQDQLITQGQLIQENRDQILRMTLMLEQQGLKIDEQGKKIDKVYDTIVGNGRTDSVVARLLLSEQNQIDAAAARQKICDELGDMKTCIDHLEKQGDDDHRTIQELVKEQEKFAAKLEKNTTTVEAWRNRAVGIGVGAGLGTSIIIYLLQQLIHAAATP